MLKLFWPLPTDHKLCRKSGTWSQGERRKEWLWEDLVGRVKEGLICLIDHTSLAAKSQVFRVVFLKSAREAGLRDVETSQ